MKNYIKIVALSLIVGNASTHAMDLSQQINLNKIADEARKIAVFVNINPNDIPATLNSLQAAAQEAVKNIPNRLLGFDISMLKQGKIDAASAALIQQGIAEALVLIKRTKTLLNNPEIIISILKDIIEPALEKPATIAAAIGISGNVQEIPAAAKVALISGINFAYNNRAAVESIAREAAGMLNNLEGSLIRLQALDLTQLDPNIARGIFQAVEADAQRLAPIIANFVSAHSAALLDLAQKVLKMDVNIDLQQAISKAQEARNLLLK